MTSSGVFANKLQVFLLWKLEDFELPRPGLWTRRRSNTMWAYWYWPRWVCERGSCSCHRGRRAMCTVCAFPYVCVCVCDRRRSPWLHLKWILQRGDPPFQAFRFLAPHPPTLQPSTQASLALSPRNGAADPGQSSLIVPPCYNVTALPSKGSRQSTALHVSMVCQCPKTGRGQGNDGRLRHDGCTFINPWSFLLFSFAHWCAPVCFLNRNWTWIWPHRVFLCVFMIADSFTTSSTLRNLLCWDKSHFASLNCKVFFP